MISRKKQYLIKLNCFSFGLGMFFILAVPIWRITGNPLFYYIYAILGLLSLYLFGKTIEEYYKKPKREESIERLKKMLFYIEDRKK